MNSEEIPPWAHSSPPPLPTGIWKKRLDAVEAEWPTVDQIALLAASLAQAHPEANRDALAGKALPLWLAAQDELRSFCEDPLRYLERLTPDPEPRPELPDDPPVPKPPQYPVTFDLALALIVGKKLRKKKRDEKFEAYLAECYPKYKQLLARLTQGGFHEHPSRGKVDLIFRSHFQAFQAWQKKNRPLVNHDRAKKAGNTRKQLDEALLTIVGGEVPETERDKRFLDYLNERETDGQNEFAKLKTEGFHPQTLRRHSRDFKKWSENSPPVGRKSSSVQRK